MQVPRKLIHAAFVVAALSGTPTFAHADHAGMERAGNQRQAWARHKRASHDHRKFEHKWLRSRSARALPTPSVPELDRKTGIQALVLLLGAGALVVGRNRRRQTPST